MHPYFRKHPSAPRRRGISRKIALRLLGAVFVRGFIDGKPACAWCTDVLTKADHSIDHFDMNHRNDSPDNLLPACFGCNAARSHAYSSAEEANDAMDGYLREKGQTFEKAMRRVEKQLATPIPHGAPKFSPTHERAIVSIWAPGDERVDRVLAEFLPGQRCEKAKGSCEAGESRLDYTRRTGAQRASASREKRRVQRGSDSDEFDVF